MQGAVDSVAPFITVNEQSKSNLDFSFHSCYAIFASGKSYHQTLLSSKNAIHNGLMFPYFLLQNRRSDTF